MTYVCAWCESTLPYQAIGDDDRVSHGICLDCAADMMPDVGPEAVDGMKEVLHKVGYTHEAIAAAFG